MRKAILVTDFLFVEAHRALNKDLVECLCSTYSVTVISVDGYYDDMKEEWGDRGIEIVQFHPRNRKEGKFSLRAYSCEIMRFTGYEFRKKEYKAVVSLAFDTIASAFGKKYLCGVPLFVLHHKNIDELTNGLKRFLFNTYKKGVYHVVFEEYFKKHLVEVRNVPPDLCLVIPHPVRDCLDFKLDQEFDCVGLCNSNSEDFIDDMLSITKGDERKTRRILLRSKWDKQSNSQVKIIRGYLDTETYNNYISRAGFVLVPIPTQYCYRLSGSIYDALSRRKEVLTTSKFYAEAYGVRYPGVCHYIENASEVLEYMDTVKGNDEKTDVEASFVQFCRDHSKETVSLVLGLGIEKMLEGT